MIDEKAFQCKCYEVAIIGWTQIFVSLWKHLMQLWILYLNFLISFSIFFPNWKFLSKIYVLTGHGLSVLNHFFKTLKPRLFVIFYHGPRKTSSFEIKVQLTRCQLLRYSGRRSHSKIRSKAWGAPTWTGLVGTGLLSGRTASHRKEVFALHKSVWS